MNNLLPRRDALKMLGAGLGTLGLANVLAGETIQGRAGGRCSPPPSDQQS